jgi:hypothetical protein
MPSEEEQPPDAVAAEAIRAAVKEDRDVVVELVEGDGLIRQLPEKLFGSGPLLEDMKTTVVTSISTVLPFPTSTTKRQRNGKRLEEEPPIRPQRHPRRRTVEVRRLRRSNARQLLIFSKHANKLSTIC